MIKFFRRIRQRLLQENRFTKYLLYAIGEIVLVVIGILIALQINTWNEKRIENNKKQSLMKGIIEDIKMDTLYFSYSIEVYERQSKNSIELLTDSVFLNIKTDSLFRKLPLTNTSFYVNSQTFEKIKNTSLSNLSGNPELDNAIGVYYISSAKDTQEQMNWETNETGKDEDFWFNQVQIEAPNTATPSFSDNVPYKQSEAKRKQLLLKAINSIEGRSKIRRALYRKQLILSSLRERNEFANWLISELEKNL
ncbi:hypothetical protein J0X14_12625 [Muricauda sp. CAU 1633]|uniref:DUF6090 family protein n=1 Tax=Allomuricauda sp. CAU 1633 TaxID=2816036 RepID=UPI001A905056|nr:DUF6090 family protein [Muricauda sp. CAU 1633]MBO0323144.1 hypothetical protein [Muricauda sp. CAU 1633]